MNDYQRIAQVIQYLNEHHTEQPDLATLADTIGLSSFHFHRLFTRWASITPKEFLQCLTLSHARRLLDEGNSVLDASYHSGLSSPGRLHDLCVKLDAASPGEIKSGGLGWSIAYGTTDTPFGRCLIAESPRGICHLAFIDSDNDMIEYNALQKSWPQADLHRDDEYVTSLAQKIFNNEQTPATGLRALVKGTSFQVQVWRALLQIKPGALMSYSQLANVLGKPDAARAVGTAIGKNTLAYLIPCHRVIRDTGVVSGYRWGQERKQAIIAWESATQLNDLD